MSATEARARADEGGGDAAAPEAGDMEGDARSAAGQVRVTVQDAIGHLPVVLHSARRGAGQVAERLPDAVERARTGVHDTTATLQGMPDSTLRLLAALSVGLSTGLKLAGAPRLVALAAMAPAVAVGGAIVTRPGRVRSGTEEVAMEDGHGLDDARRVVRDVQVQAKKAVRGIDGTDTGDRVGNAGDEVRRDLGNLGDDARAAELASQAAHPAART